MRKYKTTFDIKQRYKAYRLFGEAIKRGEIEYQPCEVCGFTPAQAHHDDYSKPLEVRFLCIKHHAKLRNSQRFAITVPSDLNRAK